MRSRDPDFPEEIPAIPSPLSETAEPPTAGGGGTVDQGIGAMPPGVTPLASGNGRSEPSAPPRQVSQAEVWTELDDSDPDQFFKPSNNPTATEDEGEERRPGDVGRPSSDAGRREADKPVAQVDLNDDWAEAEVPYQPKELGVIDQFLLLLAEGATAWRKVLRWVRSRLPAELQRQLPDEILTALLLGGLVLLLVVWNPLGRRSTAPVVAPPALPRTAEITVADGGSVQPPEGLEPPFLSSAEEERSPIAAPSPEQSLIADIQTQVSRISRSYATGLIQSVEVNLPAKALVVNVGEDWYGLINAQQDVIAQDIYERAAGLDFPLLKLRDPEGVIVARNPVVGPRMVVLKRHRPGEADWPAP